MMILGIDSAPLNCGWCAWDTNEPKPRKWGCYNPGEYGGNNLHLARDVYKWALSMIDEHSPEAIYMEGVALSSLRMNVRTWINQITVMVAIDFACMVNQITSFQVAPGQWRARFLGSASGTGPDLKLKAIARVLELGILTDNDHIAEAVGICEFGMACQDKDYLQRSKHEDVRRKLAASRERMQGVDRPLIKGKHP